MDFYSQLGLRFQNSKNNLRSWIETMKFKKFFVDEIVNESLVDNEIFYKVDNGKIYLKSSFAYLSQIKGLKDKFEFEIKDDIVCEKDDFFHLEYMKTFDLNEHNVPMPKDCIKLTIDPQESNFLLKSLLKFNYLNGKEKIINKLVDKFSKWKCHFGREFFMRSEHHSTKKFSPIRKIISIEDLLEQMMSRSWAWYYENLIKHKSIGIFYLIPWKDIREEYRIFVFKKQIRTVCQQKISEPLICSNFQSLKKSILKFQNSIVPLIHHDNFCADVYFEDEELKLIEINPWFNSGTGLTTIFPS